jgi:GNAT superfamily N-acetyltransferase
MAQPMISVRRATETDVPAIVRLVNIAFLTERFFIERDRTDADTVRNLLRDGQFLLAEDGPDLVGCVHAESHGDRGYFGMLSIEPHRQKEGIGRWFIGWLENYFRESGCKFCDLKIVNVRDDLHSIYLKLGYTDTGTSEYDDPHPTKIPVHFIHMTKPLL